MSDCQHQHSYIEDEGNGDERSFSGCMELVIFKMFPFRSDTNGGDRNCGMSLVLGT